MALPRSKVAKPFYRAARQRFEDAEILLLPAHGRTTAAVYLAGYAVECMIKALILSTISEKKARALESQIKTHSIESLKRIYISQSGRSFPAALAPHFARVNTWSTDIRYQAGLMSAKEAQAFLDSAAEVIRWAERGI